MGMPNVLLIQWFKPDRVCTAGAEHAISSTFPKAGALISAFSPCDQINSLQRRRTVECKTFRWKKRIMRLLKLQNRCDLWTIRFGKLCAAIALTRSFPYRSDKIAAELDFLIVVFALAFELRRG